MRVQTLASETRELIREAARNGVMLFLDGDRLRYQVAGGDMPSQILARLQSRKDEIIAELSRPRFRKAASRPDKLRLPEHRIDFWYETAANPSLANLTHFVMKLTDTKVSSIEAAIEAVCLRHDLLRARIEIIDGAPCLLFSASSCVPVSVVDCSTGDSPERAQPAEVLQRLIWAPFDAGSLFRVCVIKTSATEAIVACVIHHFVCDFPSCQIVARELLAELRGRTASRDPPHCRPIQYSDYLTAMDEWLSGPGGGHRLAYWKEKMAGAPAIRLPQRTDPPPAGLSPIECHHFQVDGALRAAISRLATDVGVTAATVVLAANFAALSHLLDTSDLVTTLIASGRDDPALMGLVGLTVNCIPVRVNVLPHMSYRDLIAHVREAYVIAHDYQVPWSLLMRNLAPLDVGLIAPVFNFIAGSDGTAGKLGAFLSAGGAAQNSGRPPEPGHVHWMSHELNVIDSGNSLSATVRYSPAKYRSHVIRLFADCLLSCLARAVRAPDEPIAAFPYGTSADTADRTD